GIPATFPPAGTLAPNPTYTTPMPTGAKDLAGNALAANSVWGFTTGATPDTTAPTVSATVPANAATGVAINGKIAVTFSEAMDPSTITKATFTLKQGSNPREGEDEDEGDGRGRRDDKAGKKGAGGTVSYAGVTAIFTPAGTLAPNTTYTATMTTGAKDLAGNALATNFNWSFTIGGASGRTAPKLRVT